MKHLLVSALFCALAPALSAAGQTPAPAKTSATGAQRPAAAAQKPAASAQAAPAGPTKVAVIMFQAAVSQTNEFQRNFADLQKKYDPKRAELKKMSDELDALTKQLQAQDAQMSDADRASRARTIDEKKKQLDRESQDAQSDFQNDMQQLFNSLAQKVGGVMTEYAEKEGYTLVLDAGEQESGTVLYAVPSTDITKSVIDAYNVKSGIPAPPPQAPASQPGVDAPQPAPPPSH
jgi:outer membrane protein